MGLIRDGVRRTGHLRVRERSGGEHSQSAGHGRRRLHSQAVLINRTDGESRIIAAENGGSVASLETRDPYNFEDLTVDYDGRVVTVTGRPVKLSATEYKLMFRTLNQRRPHIDP